MLWALGEWRDAHRSSQELDGMLTSAQLLQPPKPWTDLREVQERLSAPALAALALAEVREDQHGRLDLGLEPSGSRQLETLPQK